MMTPPSQHPWYQSPLTDESQILSSRIRLARNISRYPFQQKLTPESAAAMVKEAKDSVTQASAHNHFHQLSLQDLGETDHKVFLEKHIVSPEFLKGSLPKGLLISNDQNISIMINEEDHIRIQSIKPGEDLTTAFFTANKIDDLMEETIAFAFHENYGYLTACPTNVGTGLRASYMIHLPSLDKAGLIKNILPGIVKFGITLRGIYGEGTAPMGSIYQISNQTTLGKSEEDIIECLQKVTKTVIEHEVTAREKLISTKKDHLEDRIYRAYGTLAYSRKISTEEAMHQLSDIRLGYLTGILDKPKLPKQIYQIMIEIQPGHLQRIAGHEMSDQERDTARANYLRSIFV